MKIRKTVFFASLILIVLCPLLIELWGMYAYAHYPPRHTFDRDNNWTLWPINALVGFDFIFVACGFFFANGWKWRLLVVLLGLISMYVCFMVDLAWATKLTNSWI